LVRPQQWIQWHDYTTYLIYGWESREYRRAIGHLYYYSIPLADAERLECIAQTIGVAICLSIGVPSPFEVDTFIFTEPLNVIFDETANVHGSTFYSRRIFSWK